MFTLNQTTISLKKGVIVNALFRFALLSVFCLVVLCTYSCNPADSNNALYREVGFDWEDFKKQESLRSEVIIFDEILKPHQIMDHGEYLIVSSLISEWGLFVIQKSSMKVVKKMAKIGDGPDEVSDVWQLDKGLDDQTIWTFSFTDRELSEFSISNFDQRPLRKIKITEAGYQSLSANWINENAWIGYQNIGPFRFTVFDTLVQKKNSVGPWPTSSRGDPLPDNKTFIFSRLNQGYTALSQDRKTLIHSNIKTDAFEIIDLNSGKILKVIGPIKQELQYTLTGSGASLGVIVDESMKNGYNHASITDDKIFLCFLGNTYQERRETGTMSKNIFVFDFNGEPLLNYELDRSIKALAVNKNERKIYALTYEEEPGLAIFNY
ncbi:BF3164 family lipoprotein [Algoriphagus namhaensis]